MDSEHKFKNSLTRLKKGHYAKTELELSDMVFWNDPIKGEMCLQDLGTHSYAHLLCDVKHQHIEKTKIKVEQAKKIAPDNVWELINCKSADKLCQLIIPTSYCNPTPQFILWNQFSHKIILFYTHLLVILKHWNYSTTMM